MVTINELIVLPAVPWAASIHDCMLLYKHENWLINNDQPSTDLHYLT
jgi:hypothetical protein